MRAIVTGSHGAVAPYVIDELQKQSIEVIIFDRSRVDILSYDQVYQLIKNSNIQMFFHIATGPLEWIENIVKACNELNIKLIYTSSVSVFDEHSTGPYNLFSIPNAQDDYGKYKRQGENIVSNAKNYLIVRLGWQIGYHENSNNMLDYLIKQNREKGFIEASNKWYPSCSYLDQSAKVIVNLSLKEKGLFLINSNKNLTFYQIVNMINDKFKYNFKVIPSSVPERDDRMIDERVEIEKF